MGYYIPKVKKLFVSSLKARSLSRDGFRKGVTINETTNGIRGHQLY